MKNIYRISLILVLIISFTACQENKNNKPYLMNNQGNGVNPNSVAYQTKNKALDRKNRIEMAQIAAKSKLEVAKITSKKDVDIAVIQGDTQKDVVKQTATTNLEISKMDTQTQEKQNMINLYIAIGVIFALLVGMYLWYKSKKKSLEIKVRLEENRLKHEFAMKEKELQEQRIQKVLDLAISGKLPPEVQKDFITSLTQPSSKLIESKKNETNFKT